MNRYSNLVCRLTVRWIDKQLNGQIDRQMYKKIARWINIQLHIDKKSYIDYNIH